MSRMTWQDAYDIGHREVDSDHRRVLALINGLEEAAALGDGALAEAFARLAEDVAGHFAREERLMAEWGFPELDGHRDEHRRLALEFTRFRDRYLSGRQPRNPRQLTFLATWWVSHIVRNDMRLIPWLR